MGELTTLSLTHMVVLPPPSRSMASQAPNSISFPSWVTPTGVRGWTSFHATEVFGLMAPDLTI